jgi:DNA polymerase III delta subunit
MIYLFLGQDAPSKDQKIAELKKKILKPPESFRFDYEVLHAHKLDPQDLKKAFDSLPAVAPQRLLLVRECHRLSPQNKKLVSEFAKSKAEKCVLVLDSDEMTSKDAFIRTLGRGIQIVDFRKTQPLNAFDLTKAISFKKQVESLKILSQLLEDGTAPLQIMGALVWSWGQTRSRISSADFEKGLLVLQEADLNIKRSRLRPEHALEVAVVELGLLIR